MTDYLTNTVNLNKRGLQMMTYNAPSDEELYQRATLAVQDDYRAEQDRLFNQTKRKKDVMTQAARNAENDYKTAMQALKKHYDDTSETLDDEALMRGLGRSSYALDLQSQNQSDKQQNLTALLQDKMQAVNLIQNQIDALEQDFIDNQMVLSSEKEAELKGIMAGLKQERDEKLRDVLEYNNELIMDQRDYELKKLKADRDYAAKMAKKTKSTTSTHTNSRRTTKPTASSSSSLMDEYIQLSGPQKLKFFNENKDAMQQTLDLGAYKNVLREIYAYIEQGVAPA